MRVLSLISICLLQFGGAAALAQVASMPTASSATTARPRIIPSADLTRDSLITNPMLAPDGTRVLGRITLDGKTVLGIHTLAAGVKPVFVGLPADNDLRWYRWAGNSRVLISMAKTVPYFDDEAVMTRLYVWDLKNNAITLVGSKGAGLEGDDVLYVDPEGEWLLLSFQATVYDYPSVSRINLATNKMARVISPQSNVWEWFADSAGVVRTGIGFDERGWSMIYRSRDGESFRKLGRAKYDDEDAALDVIRLARDSDEGFVLNNRETGRYALYRYNFATKTLG